MVRILLGRRLIDRWEMWQPALDAISGTTTYPMFRALDTKMDKALTAA